MHGIPKMDKVRHAGPRSVPENDISKMKERQRLKIKEIGVALRSAGYVSLDEQAKALGHHPRMTWVIVELITRARL